MRLGQAGARFIGLIERQGAARVPILSGRTAADVCIAKTVRDTAEREYARLPSSLAER